MDIGPRHPLSEREARELVERYLAPQEGSTESGFIIYPLERAHGFAGTSERA
jgi:hypothetical protein